MSIINPLVFQQKRKNYIPRIFLSCWLAVLTSCCFAFASVDDVIRTFLGTIITAFAKIVLSICDLVINPLFSITTMKTSDIAKYIPGFDISGEGLGNFFSVTIGYVSMAMATVIVVCTILQYIIQLMHGEKVDSLTRIVWDICIGVILTVAGQRLLILIFDNIVAELSSAFADGAMSYSSADLNFLEASDVALSGFSSGTMVSVGESVNGVATLILCVILLCVIGWNFITLVLECAERYVVCVFLILLSPLVFSTAVSGKTKATAKNWLEMYFSHCVLLILNIWVVGIARTALDNNVIGATYTELIVWALVTYAFLKMAQKVDDMMKAAGLHVTSTGSDPLKDMIGAFGAVKGAIGATVGAIGGTIGMASGTNTIAGAVKNGTSIQDALKNDVVFNRLAPRAVQDATYAATSARDKKANLADQMKAKSWLNNTPTEDMTTEQVQNRSGVADYLKNLADQKGISNAQNMEVANMRMENGRLVATMNEKGINGQVIRSRDLAFENKGDGKGLQLVAQQGVSVETGHNQGKIQNATGQYEVKNMGENPDRKGYARVALQQTHDANGKPIDPENAPVKYMDVKLSDIEKNGLSYSAMKAGENSGLFTKTAQENETSAKDAGNLEKTLKDGTLLPVDFDGSTPGAINTAEKKLKEQEAIGANEQVDAVYNQDGQPLASVSSYDEDTGELLTNRLVQLDGDGTKEVESLKKLDNDSYEKIDKDGNRYLLNRETDENGAQAWTMQAMDENGNPYGNKVSTRVNPREVSQGKAPEVANKALTDRIEELKGKNEALNAQRAEAQNVIENGIPKGKQIPDSDMARAAAQDALNDRGIDENVVSIGQQGSSLTATTDNGNRYALRPDGPEKLSSTEYSEDGNSYTERLANGGQFTGEVLRRNEYGGAMVKISSPSGREEIVSVSSREIEAAGGNAAKAAQTKAQGNGTYDRLQSADENSNRNISNALANFRGNAGNNIPNEIPDSPEARQAAEQHLTEQRAIAPQPGETALVTSASSTNGVGAVTVAYKNKEGAVTRTQEFGIESGTPVVASTTEFPDGMSFTTKNQDGSEIVGTEKKRDDYGATYTVRQGSAEEQVRVSNAEIAQCDGNVAAAVARKVANSPEIRQRLDSKNKDNEKKHNETLNRLTGKESTGGTPPPIAGSLVAGSNVASRPIDGENAAVREYLNLADGENASINGDSAVVNRNDGNVEAYTIGTPTPTPKYSIKPTDKKNATLTNSEGSQYAATVAEKTKGGGYLVDIQSPDGPGAAQVYVPPQEVREAGGNPAVAALMKAEKDGDLNEIDNANEAYAKEKSDVVTDMLKHNYSEMASHEQGLVREAIEEQLSGRCPDMQKVSYVGASPDGTNAYAVVQSEDGSEQLMHLGNENELTLDNAGAVQHMPDGTAKFRDEYGTYSVSPSPDSSDGQEFVAKRIADADGKPLPEFEQASRVISAKSVDDTICQIAGSGVTQELQAASEDRFMAAVTAQDILNLPCGERLAKQGAYPLDTSGAKHGIEEYLAQYGNSDLKKRLNDGTRVADARMLPTGEIDVKLEDKAGNVYGVCCGEPVATDTSNSSTAVKLGISSFYQVNCPKNNETGRESNTRADIQAEDGNYKLLKLSGGKCRLLDTVNESTIDFPVPKNASIREIANAIGRARNPSEDGSLFDAAKRVGDEVTYKHSFGDYGGKRPPKNRTPRTGYKWASKNPTKQTTKDKINKDLSIFPNGDNRRRKGK